MNILVISTNPFSKVNNGKTYEALFSNFNKNELYSLFFRPHDTNIDYDYCNEYYAVSETNIILKILRLSKKCGSIVLNKPINCKCDKSNNLHSHLLKSNLKHNRLLKDLLWYTNIWNTYDLKGWVISKKIDLIFFHAPNYIGIHNVAWKLQKLLNVPMVTYYTDDYILYSKGNILNKIYNTMLIKAFKKTNNRSKEVYCIGIDMASEYSKYFKKNMKYVMNAVEILPFDIKIPSNNPTISYFGGLHLNRWKMISLLAHSLQDYAQFKIYTTSRITDEMKLSFGNNITIHSNVIGENLIKAYKESDILLHVESDEDKYVAHTMLTVSTKIPEYLMASRLVLGFGPSKIASMRMLKSNKIGVVIDSKSEVNNSKFIIKNNIENKSEYTKLIENAYNFAIYNFEIKTISKKFSNELRSIIIN